MDSPDPQHAAPAADKGEKSGSLRFFLLLLLAAWAFRSFFLQPFNIPSGSMVPTLYIGDYLVVAKWPYGFSRYSFPFGVPSIHGRLLERMPERGDVVVFRHPTEENDLIKRVIGLPGDVIAVSGGQLLINGKPVARTPLAPVAVEISRNSPCRTVPPAQPRISSRGRDAFCLYPAFRETLPNGRSYTVLDQVPDGPADNFGPVRVPGGHLFLMGDNRDDSLDSRYPTDVGGVAMVPVENLIGRALFTFWSTDGSATYVKPWTWFSALRSDRIGDGYWTAAR